ncbi:hypothetical protein BFJ66_g17228 [Fusarium oxysporum f. sp. cepae]|uniref:Uncharacterized protein n=1 Tax=Fusarium oxysporum f. sp. cepae TaxID=396571 RepID=A0A3L6NRE6_FUSOX|nr:hypothetical protein BFJ65_g4364 [Fusarium oxysporum f. sp. cepae]RKK24100.1 hypothetical protein BFJ66_g17228 [Fusarium oxysporum f. sp. cepae]
MDWADGFLLTLLAPFMGVLPSKDLFMIFYIWSIRVAKVLRKAASTRLLRAVLESNAFCRDNDKLTEDARISIEALQNAPRVAEPEEDLALQLDLSGSSVLFHNDLEFSEPLSPAGSFLTAMCDRTKDGLNDGGMLEEWPWDCWDDDRSWAIADAEIEIEFDNFASACMDSLLHIDLDTIHLMGLMRIVAVLEHGAGEKTLAEFNKLKGEGRSRQTETYMFLLAAMYFSSELGRFHDLDREPAEVAKYKGLIAQFAVLASKVVPETVEVKAQKEKLSGKKELERLARKAADPDQDILYSIRGQVRRVFVWISNPFVTSSFVGPATTTSVSVDVELATMLSFSVEVRRHMSLVDDAEEAAKGDDWTMADEALNKALRLEVNVTENNCTSRIGLIQLQKMAAEKRKDDERVRQLADELLQLELSMADGDEDGKVFNNSEIIIKIIH